MSETMINFREKFKIDSLLIYETNYWIWSLRPNQVTIGSSILSLKRDCRSFSDLNSEEFQDLEIMIKVIEKTLKKLFDYDIMNYFMLMMVDKCVHYHVIPRYNSKIEIFNSEWKDNYWPNIPDLAANPLEINELIEISEYIKNNLSNF